MTSTPTGPDSEMVECRLVRVASPDPAWVPIHHRTNNDGGRGCGRVGMYAVRRYGPDDALRAECFRLLDGRLPPPDGHPICDSCGSDALAPDGWDFNADIVAQVYDREVSGAGP